MKKYPIALYCDHQEIHFECRVVARLARVSEAFIFKCEKENLVTTRMMLHGEKGLCFADVYKLKMIRHLHEDMGLNLEAIDFVLRYQHQIKRLNHKLDQMKERIRQKEKAHQTEILSLYRQLENLME
ncbi:MAG: hypothetical protein KKE44_05300 [Proteobacteria bacterium]|nr:hypothetical protein [Pseudomonadota bacterium]MBU1582149.1 hypothetical protein [Pseudomonadota bacterium]MBU2456225.1 hypothetical protein [Pseudomonadota bacterium]MBU2628646.1 hypothetical protein [Pseudomonadota bacterium]